MMPFINRESELAFFNQAYTAPCAQLLILYGRRRVGKTALLHAFSKGKPTIYYMATRLPEAQQLKELGEVVGAFFEDPLLAENGFREWRQVFAYLERQKGPFLFLLDEFPYLVEANHAISSLWQKGWDERLSRTHIRVVLTGSSISMMERETLAHRAPLYGRRTGQLRLEPFPFRDARRFLPRYTVEDQVRAYAVFGGVPHYLSALDPARPLLDNIRNTVFVRGAAFREEVEFLLREELQEPRTYFAILQALAQGKRRPAEIAYAAALSHGTLSKYLSVLQNLGLVFRDVPSSEKDPSKSKKGIYGIADPFVRFWFRFVLGQRAMLEMDRIDEAGKALGKALDEFTAPVYEEICRDEVRRGLLDAQTGHTWTRAGRWWDRNSELDLLARSDKGDRILIGECKWSTKPVGTDILSNLEDTAKLINPAPRKNDASVITKARRTKSDAFTPIYALFSRSGFTPDLQRKAKERSDIILIHGLTPKK